MCGVELGDVGLQTFAGPTSVLQSTAIASSAAASVASQSPGWANTSNLAPVLVFFVVEETGDKRWSEMQSEHRSNRTHQPVVHPGRRRVMWSARWLVGSRQNCDAAAWSQLAISKKSKNAFEIVFGDVVRDFRMITFLKHTNSKIPTNRFTLHDYGLRLAILNRDKCQIIRSSLPGPISQFEGILSWHQVLLPGLGLGVLRLVL